MAIEFSNYQYTQSHLKDPRGGMNWSFEIKCDKPELNTEFITFEGKGLPACRKAVRNYLKEHGVKNATCWVLP